MPNPVAPRNLLAGVKNDAFVLAPVTGSD